MYFRAVEFAQVEVSARPASKYEAVRSIEPYLVEQPEPEDFPRRLIRFSNSAFEDLRLVETSIVASDFLLKVDVVERLRSRTSGRASRVDRMRLLETVLYPVVLRQITVRLGHERIAVLLFQPFEKSPPHDSHERRVFQTSRSFYRLRQFDESRVVRLVAGLAQGNQVAWGVSAGLSRLQVMYVQNRVFRPALAEHALMTVPEQHVLPDVPKAEPLAMLVIRSLGNRFSVLNRLDFLQVERGDLDDYVGYRQNLHDVGNRLFMSRYFVLDRRREPTLFLRTAPVVEPRLAMAFLPSSPRFSELPFRR